MGPFLSPADENGAHCVRHLVVVVSATGRPSSVSAAHLPCNPRPRPSIHPHLPGSSTTRLFCCCCCPTDNDAVAPEHLKSGWVGMTFVLQPGSVLDTECWADLEDDVFLDENM